jgi:hypothetical protein
MILEGMITVLIIFNLSLLFRFTQIKLFLIGRGDVSVHERDWTLLIACKVIQSLKFCLFRLSPRVVVS